MRVIYIPPSDKLWIDYYNSQAEQTGFGFVGLPYQRGAGLGSLFSGLMRMILPLAQSAAKTVGRQALETGVELASDVLAGKTIKESAQHRGRQAGQRLLNRASKRLQQAGTGLGKRSAITATTGRSPVKKRKTRAGKRKRTDAFGTYYG